MSQELIFTRIQQLEGNLSPSHVQAIRARSTTQENYLQNLEAEYQASNAAIAALSRQAVASAEG